MSDTVWLAIPSARSAEEFGPIFQMWKDHGYKVALAVDPGHVPPVGCDAVHEGPYQGYSKSVNHLIQWILANDPDAAWVVTGGDDTMPDPIHTATEIAEQCTSHFGNTFGVMQPTGDPWRKYFSKMTCGSPWMGREWCEKTYAGKGPLWSEYWHLYNDNELQDVAIKLGRLWQREDLSHVHDHWSRKEGKLQCPKFLTKANSPELAVAMQRIYRRRKMNGFPGHELI